MCNHDNSKKWQLRVFPPTALGNPVKYADPTGMQVNNSYDVEGVLPRFVPQPICESEEFQYIVTDNSWEEQAMATVRFNNAMYELNRVVTAGANNAMAFIGHDRDAAVQRALANAAVASAQADAAGKASESSWRGIWEGASASFQSASYYCDIAGTVCLAAAPITEGASLPFSAGCYTVGTISGLVGDGINVGITFYYDDNYLGGFASALVSAGFSYLMYSVPNGYKNELTQAAKIKAKKLKKSVNEYKSQINRQVYNFKIGINFIGAAVDKYFDTLNSYILEILK